MADAPYARFSGEIGGFNTNGDISDVLGNGDCWYISVPVAVYWVFQMLGNPLHESLLEWVGKIQFVRLKIVADIGASIVRCSSKDISLEHALPFRQLLADFLLENQAHFKDIFKGKSLPNEVGESRRTTRSDSSKPPKLDKVLLPFYEFILRPREQGDEVILPILGEYLSCLRIATLNSGQFPSNKNISITSLFSDGPISDPQPGIIRILLHFVMQLPRRPTHPRSCTFAADKNHFQPVRVHEPAFHFPGMNAETLDAILKGGGVSGS